LNEVSFETYEIESRVEACRDSLSEFVSKAIVDACTPKEEDDTLTDDDKTRVEEGLDHKG
jgi:hypothetical protein